MANANTEFRKKLAAVMAAIRRTIGIRMGPRRMWKACPCSRCALKSTIAIQIHMAGRICTNVSRQLENRSFTPSNSITKAPISRASGAR